MKFNRRSFFAALTAAPAIAKLAEGQPATKTPEPSVELLPYQQELLDANEPEILFTGGLGSGMTFGSARWLEQGNSLWIVEDHPSRERHLDQFRDTHQLSRSQSTVTHPTKHSRIKVITLDQLDSVLGGHFDRIAFDVPADNLLMYEHYFRMVCRDHSRSRFLVATAPAMTDKGKWMIGYFSLPGARVIHAGLPMDKALMERFATVSDDHRRWTAGEWT